MSKIAYSTFVTIAFVLNEVQYDIEVRDLNADEQKVFSELFAKESEKTQKYTLAKNKVQDIEEQMKINYELIGCVDLVQKAKLLWEQKGLFFEHRVAKDEMEELGKASLELETIYQKRFMQSVAGEGKEALVKAAKQEGLSYSVLMDILLEGAQKAKKEKSNNS